ncbi:hypothetical protein KKH23_11070 [Patescibacteria group bacterium]|nr:hypothetical protein [Patescibacteria group bacterium]MBU1067627.1 hypothetical protein [Patescibacteria group bacterium]
MIDPVEFSIMVVGCFLSMCMFSTLYGKSSPLYALAEESYIGFATGLTIVMNLMYIYNTGVVGIQGGDWILIFGFILGIATLLRINPKYSYLSRLPIAITLGAQLGLSLRTQIYTGFIDQIKASIIPLFEGSAKTLIYNWTTFICVIFMLSFFLYTIEIKGPIKLSAKIGEYLMYASFGAIFAQTFMGRLGLFVGSIQNFTVPPWKKPILIACMAIVLVALIALDKLNLLEKLTPEE